MTPSYYVDKMLLLSYISCSPREMLLGKYEGQCRGNGESGMVSIDARYISRYVGWRMLEEMEVFWMRKYEF